MRFNNGTLKDFKIEDLMKKVQETGKSLNTIRTNGDDTYFISIHYEEIFGARGIDDPDTQYFIDIIKEDKDGKQKRIYIMGDDLYKKADGIIDDFNSWVKTVDILDENLNEDVDVSDMNRFIGKPLKDFLKTIDHRTELSIDGNFSVQGDSGDSISGMSGLAHDVSWYMAEKTIRNIEIPEDNTYYSYKIITESTGTEDKFDGPYDASKIKSILASLTDNFTKDEGTVRTYYEDEKDIVLALLKKKYKYIDVADGRMTPDEEMVWKISYSSPISAYLV